METTPAAIDELIQSVGTLAEVPEVQLLIELVLKQQQQIEAQQQQIEKLKDELSKLKNRNSHNSSVPPSQDLLKKPSRSRCKQAGKKTRPEVRPSWQHLKWVWTGQSNRASEHRNLSSVWQGRYIGGASTT